MTTLNINFTETDGNVLDAADLDVFKDAVEQLLNVDKLEAENFATLQANNIRPEVFNTAQIRRVLNSYEFYALEEDAINDNSLAAAFADASISIEKRKARPSTPDTSGQVLISSPATQTVSSTATTSVFGSSSDFKCTGRLVEISMCGAANGSVSGLTYTPTISTNDKDGEVLAELYRDGVLIQDAQIYYVDTTFTSPLTDNENYPGAWRFFDYPGAGTYNYEIKFRRVTGGNYTVTNMVQVVREV